VIVCTRCGAEVREGAVACTVCTARLGTTVRPEPAQLGITGHPPTPVLNGPDPETGDEIIKVAAPGARSEMRLRDDGSIGLTVEGAGGVGRSGEGRVIKTFRQKLEQEGVTVLFETGRDAYGEDAKLRVDQDTYTFQVVTAPHADDFWREANVTSATTEVDIARAAAWVGTAVSEKAKTMSPAQRAETVLAVDAQHAGFLAAKPVLDACSVRFGDPSSEVGFASVWVVGPVTKYCSRIGDGTP
jgi:hypothetical protein